MFVTKGSINNIPALVRIMSWRRPGNKPLSEPMMVSLLTQICDTRPRWASIHLASMSFNCHSLRSCAFPFMKSSYHDAFNILFKTNYIRNHQWNKNMIHTLGKYFTTHSSIEQWIDDSMNINHNAMIEQVSARYWFYKCLWSNSNVHFALIYALIRYIYCTNVTQS